MKAVIDLHALSPVLPSFPKCGISISESRHAPGFTMPLSRYDFAEVMLVLDGEGWVIHQGVRQGVGKKHLVLVPPGASYRFEDSRRVPLSILCLCLKPSEELVPLFSAVLPKRFAVVRKLALCSEAAIGLRAILVEQSLPGPGSEQVVVGQALLLLALLQRQSVQPEMPANAVQLSARVRDYIAGLEGSYQYQETLEMVADRLKLSPKTLTRYFRTITGKSRLRYIKEMRLRQACRLLEESDQSVTSIAFACGFEDLSTFFRAFRTEYRASPGDWRMARR